jgi:hypothetical protein
MAVPYSTLVEVLADIRSYSTRQRLYRASDSETTAAFRTTTESGWRTWIIEARDGSEVEGHLRME